MELGSNFSPSEYVLSCGVCVMGRGRKPKPKAGRSPAAVSEIGAPSWVSTDARDEWTRLLKDLAAVGLLNRADRSLLVIYVQAFERHARAREEIEKLGMLIETDLGGVKSNPALSAAAACESIMLRCLSELGLTPAGRARLVAPAPARDRLDEFLAGSSDASSSIEGPDDDG